MKQTIFETRQRAEELIHEAINIWRQSDMNDSLEGLEKDPVFSLLMTTYCSILSIVVGISVSAIYTLLDFASIITSYKELNTGITFKVKRDELEPDRNWFQSLKEPIKYHKK